MESVHLDSAPTLYVSVGSPQSPPPSSLTFKTATKHYALSTEARAGGYSKKGCFVHENNNNSKSASGNRAPALYSTPVARITKQPEAIGLCTPPVSPATAYAPPLPALKGTIPHYALPIGAFLGSCGKPGCSGNKLTSALPKDRAAMQGAKPRLVVNRTKKYAESHEASLNRAQPASSGSQKSIPRYSLPTGARNGGCTKLGCFGHKNPHA
ncbi:hypothetical protein EV175_001256 [Coemansia sp. RSA 1933]|nr:hypothetical protein EV175_001256 [Coemansia sp. RSA 1933]